ncbi:DUF4406 domain-containing protein [Flavobacterium beibuense]|uniref:DUF4406 domain-containing protein n=1 Tax=Flavobacterium beibuense TaxID=657326 RepID=UPI003A92A63F
MAKRKIYIAGKITGLTQNEVQLKFSNAEFELEKIGFNVVNPVKVVNDWQTTWDEAMKKCLRALKECDAIILLPCWVDSKGAKFERLFAEAFDIPIFYYTNKALYVLESLTQKNS